MADTIKVSLPTTLPPPDSMNMNTFLSSHRGLQYAILGGMIALVSVLAAFRNAIVTLEPTVSININLQEEHYFHVSRDGFTAIDVFAANQYAQYDLTNMKPPASFVCNGSFAFNYRTSNAVRHNVATVKGDNKVTAESQMVLYSFVDLMQNQTMLDVLVINKEAQKNFVGTLAGTRHKVVNGEDRFLVVISFKNIYDNSTTFKGWLLKKEGLVPPIISYSNPDAAFEFSRAGLTELIDFDITDDGKMTVLAFKGSNWLFNADTKKWSLVPFKNEVGSMVFFTPAGFLFTLVDTYSEDDLVIWDPLTLKKLKGMTLHWSRPDRIRFSTHGAFAAVWDGKNEVQLWNLNKAELVARAIIPTVSERHIQRDPIPVDYAIGEGPQAMAASPDLKTIIVYSWLATDVQYDESKKEGTYKVGHQIVDVFRPTDVLASAKDELNLKLKK